MNYTELCTNIENICENEFSAQELAMFTEQAEQKIYNTVQIPAIRKNVTGAMTTGNKYLQIPSDFLYVYSLAVIESSGEYHYLIDKDVNFIRESCGLLGCLFDGGDKRGYVLYLPVEQGCELHS